MSLDVGYFRRWYGNFVVTDNLRRVERSDFNTFSITAPADPRLPDGGGHTIVGRSTTSSRRSSACRPDNFVTLSDTYGNQIQHWNGVDVNVNCAPAAASFVQGGTSTGRTSTDNCEVVAQAARAQPARRAGLSSGHELADAVQAARRPTGFRRSACRSAARSRDVPGAGDHRQLQRAVRGLRPVARARDLRRQRQFNGPGEPRGAGHGLRRAAQPDRSAGRQDRSSAGRTRTAFNVDLYNALNANPVIAVNSTYNAGADRDADRRVARAAVDLDGAVREVQRQHRLLNLKAVAGEDVKRKGRRNGAELFPGGVSALCAQKLGGSDVDR